MHHTLFEYIFASGVSVLSYMIARLLHYAVLKCEDADTHPRLRTVLCWVMCLFYFLGIIVTLLLGLIENLHRRRISKLHEADTTLPRFIVAGISASSYSPDAMFSAKFCSFGVAPRRLMALRVSRWIVFAARSFAISCSTLL